MLLVDEQVSRVRLKVKAQNYLLDTLLRLVYQLGTIAAKVIFYCVLITPFQQNKCHLIFLAS